ncbi:MAG: rhomboid family intramembrane serine protease [Myxococcota bacterium]
MAGPPTVACRHCGALNEADFGRCIRCGASLNDAEPADRARRRVAATRRRGPRARGLTGPGAEPFLGRFPPEQLPGVKLIILLNLTVFTLQLMGALTRGADVGSAVGRSGGAFEAFLYGALATGPQSFLPGYTPYAEPWRLLSACFVHYGILHIGMNLYGLLQLSRQVEPALGTVRYVLVYVASGIAGFATSVVWKYELFPPGSFSAGASGAVFGILGAVVGILWRQGNPAWKARASQSLIAFGVMAIVPIPIDNAAHGGGLVAGAVLAAALAKGAPRPSTAGQRVLCYLALAGCLAAIVAPRFSPYYRLTLEEIGRRSSR